MSISDEQILNHIRALEGEKDPTHSPDALKNAGDYIFRQMRSFGLYPEKSPIPETADANGNPCFNIIGGLKPQSEDKSERGTLVIGAHYDTVPGSPGADDNASGLAVLLEVARVIATINAPTQGGLIPQFVAFSLEEAGFIGSAAYLEVAEQKAIPIWGAIILECVAYTDQRSGTQKIPPGLPIPLPDRGDFIGLIGNKSSEPIINVFKSVLSETRSGLHHVSLVVPGNGEVLPDSRRSDHVPFWDKGYRAVVLTDTANFRNPHYHQVTDRLETLDIPFATKVAETLAATVIKLTGLD